MSQQGDAIKWLAGKRKQQVTNVFKLPWFFDRWYEKVILIIMTGLSVWKVLELIGGLL